MDVHGGIRHLEKITTVMVSHFYVHDSICHLESVQVEEMK
ncbi:hypothetical protein ACINNAV82_2748 [Acinetobacter baumannii Naval-82]|nr:hypothetical protein ACINNAV82_2748 [Acinetobacter baumannii Naval-82]